MKKPTLKKRKQHKEEAPSRITNDTVAEHRERILAGGRRFKYPHQYTRHKLVINTIVIAVAAFIVMCVIGWWQLYPEQNTGTLFYRVTSVVPLPVAKVDGEQVRYSDYLLRYRGTIHWLQQNGQLSNSKKQLDYYKRTVLDGVERDAYAAKLAKEKNITVSAADVDEVIRASLQASNGTISQALYNSSILESYGYSTSEYRTILRQSLLRQKVAYAIDTQALSTVNSVQTLLSKKKATLKSVAEKEDKSVQYGGSGLVRRSNQDGGLTEAASKLKVGQISDPIKSTTGDGYYIIQLDSLTSTELSYSYIKVPLTMFDTQFSALASAHKIQEYITVPQADSVTK